MTEVEILGCVMTAQYGTLSTGDILRTSKEFAAHLVNDCAAAKYTTPPVATDQADDEAPAVDAPAKRGRKPKAE